VKILDLQKELSHVLYDSPYDGAWPKAMLMRYLEEGEDQFCRDTGFFVDPLNYTVTTVAAQRDYLLDPRIIRVLNVYGADHRELAESDEQSVHPDLDWDVTEPAPRLYRTDFAPGYLTLWPVPTDVQTLTMRVWRLSSKRLCEKNEHEEPEVPSHLQRALVEYAAWKAMNHHDMELQDPIKASDHYQAYQEYVRRGRDAFHQIRGVERRVGPARCYVV